MWGVKILEGIKFSSSYTMLQDSGQSLRDRRCNYAFSTFRLNSCLIRHGLTETDGLTDNGGLGLFNNRIRAVQVATLFVLAAVWIPLVTGADEPFVATSFDIPTTLETDEFRLRMLSTTDVEKDYDAVMSSVEHLAQVWPGSGWPGDLTLEDNLGDLQRHQQEFEDRIAFAYTMVSPDESIVLGCVYINPSEKQGFDAEVYMWVRESELAAGLDSRLHTAVTDWLASSWPFSNVGMPGRGISWEEWERIPEVQ